MNLLSIPLERDGGAAEMGDSQTFSQEHLKFFFPTWVKSSQIPFVQNASDFSAAGLALKFWWQEEAITQLCVKNTRKPPPRGATVISTFMHFGISTFFQLSFLKLNAKCEP